MPELKQMQVFITTDGKQFEDEAAALAHETMLENEEEVALVAESYVNSQMLVGRTRAFNQNVAKDFAAFLLSIGGTLPEDYEGIAPSEELQVKLDEEEARVEAAAAAKKAKAEKAEEVEVVADAEVSEDVFDD
jgi:hypothetical protein